MKTVLIANRDPVEAKALVDKVGEDFNVQAICFPSELPESLQEVHLVLLDCNFAPELGVVFIRRILHRGFVPIPLFWCSG